MELREREVNMEYGWRVGPVVYFVKATESEVLDSVGRAIQRYQETGRRQAMIDHWLSGRLVRVSDA